MGVSKAEQQWAEDLFPAQITTESWALVAELPAPKAVKAFLRSPDSRRPGGAWAFLVQVEAIRAEDPVRALQLADLGLGLAGAIHQRRNGPADGLRLAAQALGVWGGIKRTFGDYDAAQAAYGTAHVVLCAGPFDPLDFVELYGRKALLWRDLRRFRKANRYALRACEIARQSRSRLWIPRTEVVAASIAIAQGKLVKGITLYENAISHLSTEDDSYYLAAVQGVAIARCDDESTSIDAAVRATERAVHVFRGRGLMEAQMWWLQARLCQRRGGYGEAARIYQAARQLFLAHRVPNLAAEVGLDEAAMYLETEERDRMASLAAVFLSLVGHLDAPEAVSAVSLLARAIGQSEVTPELLEDTRRALSQE